MSQQLRQNENYKRIKLLGEGSFGKVYLVQGGNDGSLYVIKQFSLDQMDEKQTNNTLTEVQVLKTLHHPNIVRFNEVYKTKKGKLCIVMEHAEGGDLAKAIEKQDGEHFPEGQILDWFIQICQALKYVHESKILHRDLKSQNIFLTKEKVAKLGDFGIARVFSTTKQEARTMAGTPINLSPEIVNGKEYSYQSDIWSLGVVLYELCALKPPFTANGFAALAMKIIKGQYMSIPAHYSKDMKNLVNMLLRVNPSKRPSAAEILNLPFIQKRIKELKGASKENQSSQEYNESKRSTNKWTEAINFNKLPDIQQNSLQLSQAHAQMLSHPKSLYGELKKKQSRFTPEPFPSYSILPPIIQPAIANNHAHKTHHSHYRNSNQTPEENLLQTNHHFPQYIQSKQLDSIYDTEWEFSQEMQKTIKKTEQSNLIGYKIVEHHEAQREPKNLVVSAPWKQKILKSVLKDQQSKGSPFKKIIENHNEGSLSTEVNTGKLAKNNSSQNPSLNALEVSGEKNVDLNGSSTASTKRGLSYSPEKVRKGGTKTRSNEAMQRLFELKKAREEEKLRNVLKIAEEAKREIAEFDERRKRERRKEDLRKEMFVDISKKREGMKFNQGNSPETDLIIKTPKKMGDSPHGDSEKLTYQIIAKRRNLRSRSKSDKKRRGGGKTEPDEVQSDLINGKPASPFKSGFKDVSKDSESLRSSLLRKNLPELNSAKEVKLLPKRQVLKKDSMIIVHNRLIREDPNSDSFRDSVIASTKETTNNHNLSQEVNSSIRKREITDEQFIEGNKIVKGVIDAVNKVMAGIDSTGSLHGRQSVKKQTNTCRESPETNFMNEKIRPVYYQRKQMSDSGFNAFEADKFK